jgi:hypothetical protein
MVICSAALVYTSNLANVSYWVNKKEKDILSIAKCMVEHRFILQLGSARDSNDMKNRDHFRKS